jgi:hypothetical protein
VKRYYKIADSNKELKAYTVYSLGGPNYFHGTVDPRAYYLHVAIVERADHFERITLLDNSSFKVALLPVARQSKKRAEEAERLAAEELQKYMDILAERNGIVLTGEYEEA